MQTQRLENRWPSRTRSLAVIVWAAAFVLTGVLGWSAWQGYREAENAADYVTLRQETGLAAKFPFIRKNGR